MPERNHEVRIEGRTFPDTVTVWLDDGVSAAISRDYVSKDLYESVNGACAEWRADCDRLRELVREMYTVMVTDAANCDVTYPEQFDNRMRELGIEVDA